MYKRQAAANALYGARGANGVVLITTKRGKIGKDTITVDAKWGSNSRGVPEYDVMRDHATYYTTYWRELKGMYEANGCLLYTSREAILAVTGTRIS